MEILDTLGFLLGTWRLNRTIDDRRSAARGSFDGWATLTMAGDGRGHCAAVARYDEEGDLHVGTSVVRARRSLEYVAREAMVMVCFVGGRHFVDLDLGAGAWNSDHLCGRDRYEIATVVLSPNVVEERWRVRGPAKDYDAVTTLTRAD